MALDISELDMDSATMSARYEQQMREQQGQLQKEDLSDMVAEHAAKQKVCSPPSLPPSPPSSLPPSLPPSPLPPSLPPPLSLCRYVMVFVVCALQKRKRATADSGGSKATKKLKEFKF